MPVQCQCTKPRGCCHCRCRWSPNNQNLASEPARFISPPPPIFPQKPSLCRLSHSRPTLTHSLSPPLVLAHPRTPSRTLLLAHALFFLLLPPSPTLASRSFTQGQPEPASASWRLGGPSDHSSSRPSHRPPAQPSLSQLLTPRRKPPLCGSLLQISQRNWPQHAHRIDFDADVVGSEPNCSVTMSNSYVEREIESPVLASSPSPLCRGSLGPVLLPTCSLTSPFLISDSEPPSARSGIP